MMLISGCATSTSYSVVGSVPCSGLPPVVLINPSLNTSWALGYECNRRKFCLGEKPKQCD